MDETSVRVMQEPSAGFVASRLGELRKHVLETEQAAPLKSRRTAYSYVAFISDDPEVQAVLPQVLVASSKTLTKEAAAAVMNGREDNVFLWRRKSAWLDSKALMAILRLLSAALCDLRATHHMVLSMDACPTHCTPHVARACARAGCAFVLIAAGATKWMQPCDTHLFARFKRRLRDEQEKLRLASPSGAIPLKDVVCAIAECMSSSVNDYPWARAFAHTGMSGRQCGVSNTFLRRLQWATVSAVPEDLPSLAQLQSIFRAKSIFPSSASSVCLRHHTCQAWRLWQPLCEPHTRRLRPRMTSGMVGCADDCRAWKTVQQPTVEMRVSAAARPAALPINVTEQQRDGLIRPLSRSPGLSMAQPQHRRRPLRP